MQVMPCDVAGRYKLPVQWTCANDFQPGVQFQPPVSSFELVRRFSLTPSLTLSLSRFAVLVRRH
jgi:hypothetical protein